MSSIYAQTILDNLVVAGFRITLIRRSLIQLFARADHPLSGGEIIVFLEEQKLHPNKTTIYRELEFLLSQGVIVELDFGEGKKRYELAGLPHHHHLICTRCGSIEEVALAEHDLLEQERELYKERGFKVSKHVLEFFGLCKNCNAHYE